MSSLLRLMLHVGLVSCVTAISISTVHPIRYTFADSTDSIHNYTLFDNSPCITLNTSYPSVILDYGTETGGFPFFDVSAVSSSGVQLESRYSEAKAYLDLAYADGPFTYTNGLSNTFRVETFDITSRGEKQSFFIQGGLRWQKLTLLGEGEITFCVGLNSTSDVRPIDELPGKFESSNGVYNKLWELGVRASQQACVASGAAPSTWELTKDGAYIRGQAPAESVYGEDSSNYTLSFDTKIVRGGTGWRVASSIQNFGPYFVLTSEYPDGTYMNTNRTLLPPNTIAFVYGFSLVNVTTLTTGPVSHHPVGYDVKEDQWYRISTTINATGYSVSINNSSPVFISNADALTSSSYSTGDATMGTWGFGPFQDQAAMVKDVLVQAQNRTVLYENAMTSESVLAEYGVAANNHSVCLDGSKRDRLVWTGDFAHTQRIIATSTNRSEFSAGTIAYALDWQNQGLYYTGMVAMDAMMGRSADYPVYSENLLVQVHLFDLIDYQFLYLLSAASYYKYSGDYSFYEQHWDKLELVVKAILPLVDSDGLVSATLGAFFLGPSDGCAPSGAFVYALREMASLAQSLGYNATAQNWTTTADSVADVMNTKLWNPDLGTYALSLSSKNESSLACTAFSILGGIANQTRAQSSIAALSDLRFGLGYKADSTVSTAINDTLLSPNLSGFLLEALMRTSETGNANNSSRAATRTALSVLLNDLWPTMMANDFYTSGASWEYLYADGTPGYGSYTSLSHPWAGAPTYVLSEYVLGVRPKTAGYATWEFVPSVAVTRDLDVSWAKGRVPVPGGSIAAEWERKNGSVVATVCGPDATHGVVRLPEGVKSCTVGGRTVDGCVAGDGGMATVFVNGGHCVSIIFELL